MSTSVYILSVDQGTSGTKAVIFNERGKIVCTGQEKLASNFLEGGWVEQDPQGIYQNVLTAVAKCLAKFRQTVGAGAEPATIAITNQRETFVVWDRSGEPLYPAVVWQCKRSVGICNRLKEAGLESLVFARTGLVIDPYFSATKLVWLNENVTAVKHAIQNGEAMFGTIDTWLLYKLSGGAKYLTDYTNASRTMLFDLSALRWDDEMIAQFGLNGIKLPEPVPSSHDFGVSDFDGLLSRPVPIEAMIGDSHAAAFGERCFYPGTAKATMGTGCSVLMNTGSERKDSRNGMISTICWSTADRVDYGLEGVIVSCGSTLEWLKRETGIVNDTREMEAIALSVEDNNGVYIMPAFSGLGAPHWNMNRKASITGLTFDCTKSHLVRAALESIPYQIKDVIAAMESDAGVDLEKLMTDGGISSNRFILQFLADLLGRPVFTIGIEEVSALGAAYLAGLQAGIFTSIKEIESLAEQASVTHAREGTGVDRYYEGWKRLVAEGS